MQRLDGLLHALKAEAMLAPVLRHRKRQRTSRMYRRGKAPPPFAVDDIAAVARTAATGQLAAVESATGPAVAARLELVGTLLLTASMWLLDGRTLDACFDLAAAGQHLAKVLPLGSATLMRAHQLARHLMSSAPGDVLQARAAEGWPYP